METHRLHATVQVDPVEVLDRQDQQVPQVLQDRQDRQVLVAVEELELAPAPLLKDHAKLIMKCISV
jgi:hypothetical protein